MWILIFHALSNLSANKLRSFLTMFGIIWGVISILLLSAISEGFQRGNEAIFKAFGKNIVIIEGGTTSLQAGGERAGHTVRLTIEDLFLLKERTKFLKYFSPEIIGK